MTPAPRNRLTRDHASQTYIRAGELEVFRQLQRDALALDETMADDRAFAVGPFARLRADVVVDELGKTRGAITNLWGSQEAFRAAVMNVFLNDDSLGVDDVRYPEPDDFVSLDEWIDAWAAVEIERGPRHGMDPESRYGLRWAAWLGLVPYGIWSTTVAFASREEFRLGAERYATDVVGPALEHFGLTLAQPTTISDLAVSVSTTIEGIWLSSCLSTADPIGRTPSISTTLATSLRLLIRGATR
jgi:hypothetical protein